jgi:2-methylcitrate dehydratase PrpD
MSEPDGAAQLWARSVEGADRAGEHMLRRAADCAALGIAEMVVSAREERWRAAALRLAADPGRATVAGTGRTTAVGGAVVANGLLMYANLADDTHLTACHPGVTVLPAALALAEAAEPMEGERWLRAVVAGYECAGTLAAAVLPEASQRGWRVTAAVAPLAAATVAILLEGEPAAGPDALRLAASAVGGPLAVFGSGDAWRLQPGLAAVEGLHAARAAAGGLAGAPETLDGEGGALAHLAGAGRSPAGSGDPAILGVTFKRFRVPMYGQAICAAFEDARLDGQTAGLRIRVPTFATEYADQRAGSVTSVQGIALAGLASGAPRVTAPPPEAIEVIGDDGVGGHGAEVEVTLEDGTVQVLRGDGDTSGWTRTDVERHCRRLLGGDGGRLAAVAHELLGAASVEPLLAALRSLR